MTAYKTTACLISGKTMRIETVLFNQTQLVVGDFYEQNLLE